MAPKRSAPHDEDCDAGRVVPDFVTILATYGSLLNHLVLFLENKDIATLRLVSSALAKLFSYSLFWEHVTGTKRLARLSPLPPLPDAFRRNISELPEEERYDGNYPSIPDRLVCRPSGRSESSSELSCSCRAFLIRIPLSMSE